MNLYIINVNGHFFEVRADAAALLDTNKLKAAGCELCPNKAIMYESVMATHGLDLDEVECGEFVIQHNQDGKLVCIEARGISDPIEDSVEYQRGGLEEYISDYLL